MRVCRLFALLETGLNELVKGRGGFLGDEYDAFKTGDPKTRCPT